MCSVVSVSRHEYTPAWSLIITNPEAIKDFSNQQAPLLLAKHQLSKYLLKCHPSLYSHQLSLTHKRHGDTSVVHQAFKSGSRSSLGLLNGHSTYLVPACGCVSGPEGSWPAGHTCWRQYHNPAGPEARGWRCRWHNGQARHSLGSRIGRMQEQNTWIIKRK